MMNLNGIDIVTDFLESDCAYIKGQISLTEYNIISHPTFEMAEDYLDKGWRRFGKMFFRPNCSHCAKCIPLKIELNNFKLSKSMRRSINKNKNVRVEISSPKCTLEHLNLHNLYHKYQSETKGWPEHSISPSEYQMLFCESMPFSKEFRYYSENEKLIGVGYVDVLRSSYSSLYFFYHPDWAPQSPGIFSALTEINHAIKNNSQEYHLGYYVPGCPSMDYKLRFRPYKLLKGDGDLWSWDEANWK